MEPISIRTAPAFAALLLLAGCVSFTPHAGFDSVTAAMEERGGPAPRWARNSRDSAEIKGAVSRLLASGPLTADTAVQVALINNPGLQATYAELGIAEAELVQSGRMRNPGFSFARSTRGGEVEIERAFIVDVLGLLTMPFRTQIEKRRFELAKTRVAAEAVRVSADTRRAYYAAVAAEEGVRYMGDVQAAADASAELARRLAAAGNFSKLDHARQQLFYAETTAQLARVLQATLAKRESLTRLMGLTGSEGSFRLPERLPELPKAAREIADIEATALRRRLDVQGAMQDAEGVASSLGLTRATGFVSVLELAYRNTSETGMPRQNGYEIELRLPIFDWGAARAARAEHTYMQAVSRAADVAVRARSEVRESYNAYRTAFDLARHYREEIVPLRKRISEETVLRYNAMLISVFELLADARQQTTAVNAYIETLRDFWIADATLDLALTGTSPGAIGGRRAAATQVSDDGAGH